MNMSKMTNAKLATDSTIIAISHTIEAMASALETTVGLYKAYYAHAPYDDLDLDARSSWVGKGKHSVFHSLLSISK